TGEEAKRQEHTNMHTALFERSIPGPGEIRANFRCDPQRRSTPAGLTLFMMNFILYWFVAFAVLALPSWTAKLVAGLLAGILMGTLFIVAHDACHGSLTPHLWLNRVLGTLAMLPSLTPYKCWELGHNQIHHRWTLLRDQDYVWRPLSFSEYTALSGFRKWLERFYKTIPGLGLYFASEIWWKHLLFPRREDWGKMRSPFVARIDQAVVLAFLVVQTVAFVALNRWLASFQ